MDSAEIDYVPRPIVYALHNFTKKFQLIYPNNNILNSRRPECVGIKRNKSIIPKLRFLKKYFSNQIKLRKVDNCWTCCKNSFDQLLPKSIIDGLQPQQLYPFIKLPTMSPKKGRCNQNGSGGESSPKIRPTPTDDEDDNDFVEILSISKPEKSFEEIVIDSDSDTGTVSNTTRITSHSLISTESKKSASSSVEDEVEVVFSTNVPTSKSVSELEMPMPPPTTSLPKPVHPLGNDIVSTPERPLENGDTETVLLISTESKKSASSSVEDDEVEVIFSTNVSTSKSVPELQTSMPPPTISPPKSVRPVGNDIISTPKRPIQTDIVLPPSPTILITSDPVVDSDSVVDSELETVIRTPKRKRVVVSSSSSESSSDESSAPPFASTKLSDSAVIRLKNCRVGIERLSPSCTRRILPKRACRRLHFQQDKELFSKLDEIDKLISQPAWNSSDSDSNFEPAPNTSFPVSDTGSESDSDNLHDSDSGPNVSDCSNEESESGPNVSDCSDAESDSDQNVSDCSNEESESGPNVSERSDDESDAEEDEQERTRRDLLTTQMSRPIVVMQTVAEKQQLIEEMEQNEKRKIRQRGARTEYMESYMGHLPFVPVTLEVAMVTLTKNLGWDVFPFGAKLLGKSPTKDDLGAMNRSEKAVQWETLKIDFVVKHFQEVLRLKKDENDEWICCQNALNFLDCKAFLKLFWNLST